jgi:hypothetical protein
MQHAQERARRTAPDALSNEASSASADYSRMQVRDGRGEDGGRARARDLFMSVSMVLTVFVCCIAVSIPSLSPLPPGVSLVCANPSLFPAFSVPPFLPPFIPRSLSPSLPAGGA